MFCINFLLLNLKLYSAIPTFHLFLQHQIHTQLAVDAFMAQTSKALADGFPLFLNPMIDIERQSSSLEANVLLTMQQLIQIAMLSLQIEYLPPLKFNVTNGPLIHTYLVLLTCPKSIISCSYPTDIWLPLPLAVNRLPCNESFSGLVVGLGTCPKRLTMSVWMASAFAIQFTPRATVNSTPNSL